jgi:hypothetical protein
MAFGPKSKSAVNTCGFFLSRMRKGFKRRSPTSRQRHWIARSEPVDDIEQGKDRAEEPAKAYLKRVAGLDLPTLQWKEPLCFASDQLNMPIKEGRDKIAKKSVAGNCILCSFTDNSLIAPCSDWPQERSFTRQITPW